MFTLLPERDMQTVMREYRLRLITVAVIFLLIATVLAGTLLSPSFVLTGSREKIVAEKLDTVLATQKKLLVGDPDTLARDTKELIQLLSARTRVPTVSSLVDRALYHRTAGIRITAINTTVSDSSTVILSGIASTRQSLSSFVKKLEADGEFSAVSVPVSNFAKSTNLEFSLSITFKPAQS